jgi:hypothetical protein
MMMVVVVQRELNSRYFQLILVRLRMMIDEVFFEIINPDQSSVFDDFPD